MLQLNDIHSGYGDITVLRALSFHLEKGRVLGVMGRNGMGKSTLIHTISGLVKARSGSIRLFGDDVTAVSADRRARLGVSTVIQGRGIFPQLKVREHLRVGRLAGGQPRVDRLPDVLTYFPRLKERLDQYAGTLSGGEQQMLAIGTGLMGSPRLMLLDEPSDGVMPSMVLAITDILREINRSEGMSIVVVEQNVRVIRRLADDCIILENGAAVASGSCSEITSEEVVHKYLSLGG